MKCIIKVILLFVLFALYDPLIVCGKNVITEEGRILKAQFRYPYRINRLFVAKFISHSIEKTAQINGQVVDTYDARVSVATLTFIRGRAKYDVVTAADGTYQAILPRGTYRVVVVANGFCPMRRARFKLNSATVLKMDFVLFTCPIVNKLFYSPQGQLIGEEDRYQSPYKEDLQYISNATANASHEIFFQFGEQKDSQGIIEYSGFTHDQKRWQASISYDLLLIHADRIILAKEKKSLEAKGNVVFSDGSEYRRCEKITIDLSKKVPSIKIE